MSTRFGISSHDHFKTASDEDVARTLNQLNALNLDPWTELPHFVVSGNDRRHVNELLRAVTGMPLAHPDIESYRQQFFATSINMGHLSFSRMRLHIQPDASRTADEKEILSKIKQEFRETITFGDVKSCLQSFTRSLRQVNSKSRPSRPWRDILRIELHNEHGAMTLLDRTAQSALPHERISKDSTKDQVEGFQINATLSLVIGQRYWDISFESPVPHTSNGCLSFEVKQSGLTTFKVERRPEKHFRSSQRLRARNESLATALSAIYIKNSKAYLLERQLRMEQQCMAYTHALNNMITAEAPFILAEICRKEARFATIVVEAACGAYSRCPEFFINSYRTAPVKELLSAIQRQNVDFETDMKAFLLEDPLDRLDGTRRVSSSTRLNGHELDFNERASYTVDFAKYIDGHAVGFLEDERQDSQGLRLVCSLIRDESLNWRICAKKHIENILNTTGDFLHHVLTHVYDCEIANELMKDHVEPFVARKRRILNEKLEELLLPYQNGQALGYAPTLTHDFCKKYKPTNISEDALLVLLQNYLNAVLSNFIDNLACLAIENCLMRSLRNYVEVEEILNTRKWNQEKLNRFYDRLDPARRRAYLQERKTSSQKACSTIGQLLSRQGIFSFLSVSTEELEAAAKIFFKAQLVPSEPEAKIQVRFFGSELGGKCGSASTVNPSVAVRSSDISELEAPAKSLGVGIERAVSSEFNVNKPSGMDQQNSKESNGSKVPSETVSKEELERQSSRSFTSADSHSSRSSPASSSANSSTKTASPAPSSSSSVSNLSTPRPLPSLNLSPPGTHLRTKSSPAVTHTTHSLLGDDTQSTTDSEKHGLRSPRPNTESRGRSPNGTLTPGQVTEADFARRLSRASSPSSPGRIPSSPAANGRPVTPTNPAKVSQPASSPRHDSPMSESTSGGKSLLTPGSIWRSPSSPRGSEFGSETSRPRAKSAEGTGGRSPSAESNRPLSSLSTDLYWMSITEQSKTRVHAASSGDKEGKRDDRP